MAGTEAFVNVTEGSGKKLHGIQRTIGANDVIDEYVQLGEPGLPTYSVLIHAVATATANSHMLQLMAGSTLPVRVRRITIAQVGAPAAVTAVPLQIFRVTTAGTGGTAITARPFDTTSAASGATGMTLPTAKGTEGVQLFQRTHYFGTAAIPVRDHPVFWEQMPNAQPIVIPAGTANGIVVKNPNALATATCDIVIEFTEANFV